MIRVKSPWLLAVSLCLGFLAAACSSNSQTALPQAPPAGADEEYRLGTGDQLRIIVFGHEDLSMENVQVDSAGRITMPLAGDLRVVGLSVKEVEESIESALSPEYLKNPVVSVEVLEHRAFYIIGEVADPGPYPYSGGMRVINAVAMAGGFTYRAVEDEFVIQRDGQAISAGKDTPVRPGDVIEVAERFF
ncbi:MAG: polysaccharide biosynthesis/export family protein [Kiloniellales bacterium]|nr:polysaccharide biosynthesis/export family protein [Kiloniellales bacterium]